VRQRDTGGEATLDVWGTFSGEAIRFLILFVAQQLSINPHEQIRLHIASLAGTETFKKSAYA